MWRTSHQFASQEFAKDDGASQEFTQDDGASTKFAQDNGDCCVGEGDGEFSQIIKVGCFRCS